MIDLRKNKLDLGGVENTFIITAVHDLYIEKCLKSLWNTTDRDKHRLVFIDSPSLENRPIMYDLVKDYVDIYVRTEKNYGWDKTINLGMMWSYTPYFTIFHDDVKFIQPGWWDICRQKLDEDEGLYMIQPSQRNRRGYNYPEDPTAEDLKEILRHTKSGSMSEIYCMVFKQGWINRVGYFDERIYPIGPEDLDFYNLAKANNIRMSVTAEAVVYHKGQGRMDARGGARLDEDYNLSMNEKWGGDKSQPIGGLTSGGERKQRSLNVIKPL